MPDSFLLFLSFFVPLFSLLVHFLSAIQSVVYKKKAVMITSYFKSK